MEEGYKDCPYCAETIKAGAIKCKHCKSLLANNSSAEEVVIEQQVATNDIIKSKIKTNKHNNSNNYHIESNSCRECGTAIEGIENLCPQCGNHLEETTINNPSLHPTFSRDESQLENINEGLEEKSRKSDSSQTTEQTQGTSPGKSCSERFENNGRWFGGTVVGIPMIVITVQTISTGSGLIFGGLGVFIFVALGSLIGGVVGSAVGIIYDVKRDNLQLNLSDESQNSTALVSLRLGFLGLGVALISLISYVVWAVLDTHLPDTTYYSFQSLGGFAIISLFITTLLGFVTLLIGRKAWFDTKSHMAYKSIRLGMISFLYPIFLIVIIFPLLILILRPF